MPLTPTDVANKQFRIAFRGYSLDEVDAFLDEVETELSRLLRENSALQERAASAASAPSAAVAPAPAAAPGAAQPPVLGTMEGQEAALRTLLLAQRTADEAIAEARAEAEQIVSSARSQADEVLKDARSEAERTLSESREKAARVDQEVAARVQAATGDLDTRRRALEARIEELRAFEREYRTRLKAYLETQLRDLETGTGGDDGGAGVPAGARSAAVAGSVGAGQHDAPAAPQPGGQGAPADAAPARPPGPVPVPGRGGPGTGDEDAPDGPPREADGAPGLRAAPPLASGGPSVGPFTVVPSSDSAGDDADR